MDICMCVCVCVCAWVYVCCGCGCCCCRLMCARTAAQRAGVCVERRGGCARSAAPVGGHKGQCLQLHTPQVSSTTILMDTTAVPSVGKPVECGMELQTSPFMSADWRR